MSKMSVGRGGKIFPGRVQHQQRCRDHRKVHTLFGLLRGAGMKIRLDHSSRYKTYTTQVCLPARLISNHLPLCCLSFFHTSFSHPRTFAHDFARVRDVLLRSLGCLPWTFRSRGLHRADHHIHRGIFLHDKSEVILFVYSFIICSPKANNLHECRRLVCFFHYIQRLGQCLLIGKELPLGVSRERAHFDLFVIWARITDHRSVAVHPF